MYTGIEIPCNRRRWHRVIQQDGAHMQQLLGFTKSSADASLSLAFDKDRIEPEMYIYRDFS